MKNFLIYKSSAGSGKTYTLVKEYLRIVLSKPADFRHTLAVTFTIKASEEMKTRVMEKLADLAAGRDPKLEAALKNAGVKADIALRASEVLEQILHNYSYFAISTIDSFFYKIILSFARELKLQLGFDIELELDMVLRKVIDEMFDQCGEDAALREYLENYVYYNIDEDGDWRIERKVKNLAGEIFKERYWEKKEINGADLADSRSRMTEFISVMFSIVNTFENTLLDYSRQAQDIFDEHSLTDNDFRGKSRNSNVSYLLKKIPDRKYEPNASNIEASKDMAKWYTGIPQEKLVAALNAGLFELHGKALGYYLRNYRKYYTAKELTGTVYILGIFNDLLEKLKDYRDENKTLLISDINNIIRKVISDESSPFIYEKIGNTYKNFLIDEFQDTSNFQWNNFLPLIINSISEGGFSMIVGDVKQSIYRWRSGNMKLLLEKVQEDLSVFKDLTEVIPLEENWRSTGEIIDFNNSFFEKAATLIAGKNEENEHLILDAYSDIEQTSGTGKKGGYVNITFIPNDKESELNTAEISDAITLENIKKLLEDGYKLRDIMILTRNNKEGSFIAETLMRNNYNVISNESLLISGSPKIKLLISLLKFITDNQNTFAKTEALYQYMTYIKNSGIPLSEIFVDYKKRGDSLIAEHFPAEFWETGFAGIKVNHYFSSLTIQELTENLIRIFISGSSADAYLLRFMDTILEYTKKNNSDITGFLNWWEENKESVSIVIPSEEDAIKVLTIHTAKGLQSPAVLIPYANWEFNISGSKDYLWVSSEMDPFNRSSAFLVKAVTNLKNSYFEQDYIDESVMTHLDNLNLLYVAFTRAAERLYVNCPEKFTNSFNAYKLIRTVLLEPNESADNVFEFGKAEPAARHVKYSAQSVYDLTEFSSSDPYNKLTVKKHISELDLSSDSKLTKINRGIVLHKALSYIIKADDSPEAVKKLLAEGLIKESEAARYEALLREIINVEETKEWFSGKYTVKTENDILVPKSRSLRPDRIMIDGKNIILVDYKTGKENKDHEAQINSYAEVLKSAGFEKIDKFIYYITDKKGEEDIMQHFLDKLADKIISVHGSGLDELCVVFPSRRAGIFFRKYLSEKILNPVFAPEILGIRDFIDKLSPYTIEDKIVLIFELFEVYKKYLPGESFDKFYSWGEMILGDFDDIDKNLVNASGLFRIIREHREIEESFELTFGDLEEFEKFWRTFTSKDLTESQHDFIKTWEILGRVYAEYRQRIAAKNICYEGMSYRKIYEEIRTKKTNPKWGKIIFAGFNALNKAEEGIIRELINSGKAEIYWDADEYFTDDVKQEAGRFLRSNFRNLEISRTDLNWIDSNLSGSAGKNIKIIGAPLLESQVKSLGAELKKTGNQSEAGGQSTAIVLPDESLLMPLLHSLPEETGSFNITMGYPMKDTSLYSFIELLKDLQKHKKGKDSNPVFYHRDVTGLLMHPYLRAFDSRRSSELTSLITKRNIIYVSANLLSAEKDSVYNLIFRSSGDIRSTIDYLNEAAGKISEKLRSANSSARFETEYFYSFFTQLNRLSNIIAEFPVEMSLDTFWKLLIEILQTRKIPFEGEPLNGVQIMGVLETRALDFDNVFILSMNEGTMPKGSAGSSFIPYRLRKAFLMPTFEDEDAISAYYFYRLISRAKNVYLFYNTESGIISAGEKSRFIMQIQSELAKKNENIKIEDLILHVPAIFTKTKEINVIKDPSVMKSLGMIEKFSATALGSYISCPLKFYLERIARLKEEEDIEEFFGGATFGNIFHGLMSNLYESTIGTIIDSNAIKELKNKLETEFDTLLQKAFVEINKEREFQTEFEGKNLLYKGIIKKLAGKILELDSMNVPFKIIALETDFEKEIGINTRGEIHKKILFGRIDRIDEKDGMTRIIDYKTGKVTVKKLSDFYFDKLFTDPEFKEYFQTYFYSALYLSKFPGSEIMAGIYPLRNITEGLRFIGDGAISASTAANYSEGLNKVLEEIHNPDIPFSQTTDIKRCTYCAYKSICHRD